jgi:hypothetical protein
MTAVNIVAPEDMIRHVSATDSTEQCQDSCTYDDNCVGYTQDSVRKTCDLMYDITGFTSNTENLFTKRSGIKLRDFLGENKADGKYMRFENKELPPAGGGKMAAYQFINNIDDCKTKCLESRDPMSKCMAFEYDFKAKTCTINSKIDGKLGAKASKDTYAIIN